MSADGGGRDVWLSWDGGSVFLRGDRPADLGLFVSGDGIEGWEGSPEAKVDLSERSSGDGAHPVDGRLVLYAARTVTVPFYAHGSSRAHVLSLLEEVGRALHRVVRLRVADADRDTFCEGYVATSVEPAWRGDLAEGELTVVCADPRRYSTRLRTAVISPAGASTGGLCYGDGMAGLCYGGALAGLCYGDGAADGRNVAVLDNAGNATCLPTLSCTGPFPDGVTVHSGSSVLSYGSPVGSVPVVLDSLGRTATVGGVDQSRALVRRGFPEVPPGGSVAVSLQSPGTGFCVVSWRDTYI